MISLARISVEISKEVENSKKVYDYIITKFLTSNLSIRTNEDIQNGKDLPNLNKIHLLNLKKYYAMVN